MLALRARYKELAKQLHPDLNGADRGAEERMKDVNRAYSLLRQQARRRPGHGTGGARRSRPLTPADAAGWEFARARVACRRTLA